MRRKKVLVIGLDCATPRTLFKDFLDECPNIKKMVDNGVYGILQSCNPPITIPAWMVMATGKKPGTLGIYGFRQRNKNSYKDYSITNSYNINEPTIWDILGEKGLRSCIVGVPPSYPIKPINGNIICSFLVPDKSKDYTYPPELKEEIQDNIGDYIIDVPFRTENKVELLENLYKMTEIQFKTIKYLIKNKKWNFFKFVIIGLDRIHHAFWKYYDHSHHKYTVGNEFEFKMMEYYKFLDKEVGEILDLLNDDTIVLTVSDHGAKAMKGCICVNMALEKLGFLKFKSQPKPGTSITSADIDWDNTYAWGWGGYDAKIFLNVKDREENGIIEKKDYEKIRDDIAQKISNLEDHTGNQMNTKVYKLEDLNSILRGNPPDLMVYFDDLNWRSAGTVGYDSIYLMENDTGPDDAVHDHYGIYIIYNPKKKLGKNLGIKSILDIVPTILNEFGFEIPEEMEGKIIK